MTCYGLRPARTAPTESLRAAVVPLVDLETIDAELAVRLQAAFLRVLASGRFVAGEEVARFEAAFADHLGVRHVIGVASGTAALYLALMAAGVGPGDEVVLPANTFFATFEAVLVAGATPVLCDVDLATGSIDPASVEAVLTARTAAVIGVHLYGLPVDGDRLRRIAARHGLLFLEDGAQALGASWGGQPVGSLGDAAAFSFFPTKNMGALGEAGAVATNDDAIAQRVRTLRSHGELVKNVHTEIGFNERLDELQAAFLSAKLEGFNAEVANRTRLGRRYRALLEVLDGVTLLAEPHPARPAYHLLVTRVAGRDAVLASLHARGVQAAVHYPTPVHLQPAAQFLNRPEGSFPNTESLAATVLSMPFFPHMTSPQMHRSVRALADAVAAVAGR